MNGPYLPFWAQGQNSRSVPDQRWKNARPSARSLQGQGTLPRSTRWKRDDKSRDNMLCGLERSRALIYQRTTTAVDEH